MSQSSKQTEWEGVEKWYDQIVGEEGHYYHRQIIIPKLLKLFDFESFSEASLLDLACGQGVLARHIPPSVTYHGIDLAPSLIHSAQRLAKKHQTFAIGDICKPLAIKKKNFTHVAIILALQNVAEPEQAIHQAAQHLQLGGILAIVLNHPCFRIPRQSSWGVDANKVQYRRIDRYLSPLNIPIQMHPAQGRKSQSTVSFHHSLSDFSQYLAKAGFVTMLLEEWTSDKVSTGKMAKMENRARAEFPLFLTFLAQKAK